MKRRLLQNKKASTGYDAFTDPDAMVFTIKTDGIGTSNDDQFTIPTFDNANFDYDYTAYTEGGQVLSGNTGDLTITFPIAGTYKIAITGIFATFYFNNVGDRLKLLSFDRFGGDLLYNTNQSSAFNGCQNLTTFPHHQIWDDAVTLIRTFANCDSIVFDNAITFGSVTNASYMFNFCNPLTLPTSATFASLQTAFAMFQQIGSVTLPSGVTFGEVTDGRNMFYLSSVSLLPEGITFAKLLNGTNAFRSTSLTDLPSTFRLDALTIGSNIFFTTIISTTRYSQLLIDLEAFNTSNGVSFGADAVSQYYNASGETARNILTSSPRNWTIIDAGLEP